MKIQNQIITLIMFGILSSFILISCDNEASEKQTQSENTDEQLEANITMYKSVWDDIVNNGNLDAINEKYFDENITMIAQPENIVGIKNFKEYYENFITGFSDRKFTVVEIFGKGDRIVKHWNFKGKHTGEFFGIPATGNEVDISGVTLGMMNNGRIAQEQDFMDNLEFMQQLGVIPRE